MILIDTFMIMIQITLTACQDEVTFMIVQGVEAKLHCFANNSDVTPSNMICDLEMFLCGSFHL